MRIYTPEEEARLDTLAIETWGIQSQLDQLVEECAELILAVQKMKRCHALFSDNFPEEMGDVMNCINLFKPLYPDYEKIRQSKLNRLAGLLGDVVPDRLKPDFTVRTNICDEVK